MSTSFRTVLLLACAVAATPAPANENPLQAHRERAARQTRQPLQIKAEVIQTIGDNQLVLAIAPDAFKNGAFNEGDRARLRIADNSLEMRFLAKEHYLRLVQNNAMREMLDVDVIFLLDDSAQPGNWIVIGLSGGLVDWLQAKPGLTAWIEGGVQ